MYRFYWMDSIQFRHRLKSKVFAKALEYLQHNGINRRRYVDFLDESNVHDQGKKLNAEFDAWLTNNWQD